ADLTNAQRREYRRIIEDEGLTFVGLHWLMVSPKGLHVTTSDTALRERSWNHIRNLINLCADLGPSGVLVFGSPQQRGAINGMTREEATRNYVEGLIAVAPLAEGRGVTLLIEALPLGQCDVVQSLDEAASLVRDIGSPAVQTMFDTHNAVDEIEAHAELLERHFDIIRHVHVNEMDGRHPGAGDYDFKPVLSTLKKNGYNGWVSLEAFDFTPGAETIASESIRYMKEQIERLPA
ncbi:MAG TPA: sugar phosphate isomerase/epimerase family protein, partial [Bryobacteraceae bacterium]|nr:sugar phosphate isomerase/epimerase family protein [Bryobacteraceae bacterium]